MTKSNYILFYGLHSSSATRAASLGPLVTLLGGTVSSGPLHAKGQIKQRAAKQNKRKNGELMSDRVCMLQWKTESI